MRKKLISALLCVVMTLGFVGCGLNHAETKNLTAKITDISGSIITVMSVEEEMKESPIEIVLNSSDAIPKELKIGDVIEITYCGGIMETYPAKFEEVISIKTVEEK